MAAVLRPAGLLLLLTALAAVGTAWWHPLAPEYAPVVAGERSPLARTLAEVQALAEPVLWIDARASSAYAVAHIPGAVWLAEDDWEAGFEELMMVWSPEQMLIVYCDAAACHASEAVVRRLRRDLGVETIYYLEGGWAAWQEQS